MINYKEFEVIKALLDKKEKTPKEIFDNTHHYVFKNVEEVQELLLSLEKKHYLSNLVIQLDLHIMSV